MTKEQQTKVATVFKKLWEMHTNGGECEGCDLDELFRECGLTKMIPATDIQAHMFDVEQGEMLLFLNDDGLAVVAAAGDPV